MIASPASVLASAPGAVAILPAIPPGTQKDIQAKPEELEALHEGVKVLSLGQASPDETLRAFIDGSRAEGSPAPAVSAELPGWQGVAPPWKRAPDTRGKLLSLDIEVTLSPPVRTNPVPTQKPVFLRELANRIKLSLALLFHGLAAQAGPLTDVAVPAGRAAAAQFLAGFETIRIGIDQAPGNGHQAASATVIKRLRQLGFKGRLEVGYDPRTKNKLEYLLPGFDPQGPPVQELGASGVTAVSLDHLQAEKNFGRLPLGILGATDGFPSPDWLKVDHLLTVQPYKWDGASIRVLKGKEAVVVSLKDLEDVPLGYDLPAPENPQIFIAEKMSATEEMRVKIPGLTALVEAEGRIETLPAYGLGRGGVDKLYRLIEGIRYAQNANPERFRGGVVIPLISRLNDEEFDELEDRIKADYDSSLQGNFSAAAVGSSDIRERIAGLKRGEILLMRVGPVAQDVFDFLFSRSSLPPTVAGRNGQNLMVVSRKPFFNTVWTEETRELSEIFRGSAKDSEKIARMEHGRMHGGVSSDDVEGLDAPGRAIGEFILAAMDEGSDLRAAYGGENARDSGRDKIVEALIRTAKLMRDPAAHSAGFFRRLAARLLEAFSS